MRQAQEQALRRPIWVAVVVVWLAGVGCNRVTGSQRASTASAKREVTGTWKGVTQVDGTRLTIVLRLRRGSDGTYSGTFESPDQHSGQIDMDQVSVRNGRLHVAVSGIQFTLDGGSIANVNERQGTRHGVEDGRRRNMAGPRRCGWGAPSDDVAQVPSGSGRNLFRHVREPGSGQCAQCDGSGLLQERAGPLRGERHPVHLRRRRQRRWEATRRNLEATRCLHAHHLDEGITQA